MKSLSVIAILFTASMACLHAEPAPDASVKPSAEILSGFENAEQLQKKPFRPRAIIQPVRVTTRAITGVALDPRGIKIVPHQNANQVQVRIVPNSQQSFENILLSWAPPGLRMKPPVARCLRSLRQ